MKRYMLFAFYQYYPNGGMDDFVDSFDSIELAKIAIPKEKEYYHIWDSVECKVVLLNYTPPSSY